NTVRQFSLQGQVYATYGTPGLAGSSLNPLQFSSVADVDFDGTSAFISDGDGGINNRVIALKDGQLLWSSGWAGSGDDEFSSPHTVAYVDVLHAVLVGDRGNNRIQALNAQDGTFMWAYD
ncbi:uncharacterized protein MONBRDRAFT_2797, partial [Monosiga brevicollis MX1]